MDSLEQVLSNALDVDKHGVDDEQICHICGGTGYVYMSSDLGDPNYGRLFPCLACSRDDVLGDLLSSAGLEPGYIPPSLGEITSMSDAQRIAIAAMLTTIQRGWGFVYLWGKWGTGKTFLAEAALRSFFERNLDDAPSGAFWTMPDLMAHFRDQVRGGGVHELQKRLQRTRFLVLDEVDKIQGTPFVQEQFFTLVDRRYRAALRLRRGITIFTANVKPERIGEQAGYFASRVDHKGFFVIPFAGQDLRQQIEVV